MKATPMRRLAALAAAVVVLLGPASLFGAAPAYAAASLTVSKTTGLKDGDRVTVNGSGFSPNMKQIAVGQCKAGMKGPSDCNLAGGATFVNADASGKIPTVTLSVKEKFGSFDCTRIKCIIGAQILPQAGTPAEVAANTSIVEISFGGAAPAPTKTTPGPGQDHADRRRRRQERRHPAHHRPRRRVHRRAARRHRAAAARCGDAADDAVAASYRLRESQ